MIFEYIILILFTNAFGIPRKGPRPKPDPPPTLHQILNTYTTNLIKMQDIYIIKFFEFLDSIKSSYSIIREKEIILLIFYSIILCIAIKLAIFLLFKDKSLKESGESFQLLDDLIEIYDKSQIQDFDYKKNNKNTEKKIQADLDSLEKSIKDYNDDLIDFQISIFTNHTKIWNYLT